MTDGIWEELGVKSNTEWVWLADTCLCYMQRLIRRTESEGRVVIDAESLARDLEVINEHRAIVHARETGVIRKIADNQDFYAHVSFPDLPPPKPVVRTPIVLPDPAPASSEVQV